MSSKGIWLTVLMRSAHFNSLTHFDVTQQPLLLHIPCNKFSGGVNHRKRVGMTYLPTMEVKNVNRCFRHLLITFVKVLCAVGILKTELSALAQKPIKGTKAEFTTSAQLLANRCYRQVLVNLNKF